MNSQPDHGIHVANAPVSYGAFELTVGIDPRTPDGEHVLDEVAGAGYSGIDLGPVGYLGSGGELGERLAARGLGLAGGYLELPYADPVALQAMLPELDAMLDCFDAVAGRVAGPPPHPTIADSGDPRRRARPGRAHAEPSLGMDEVTWPRWADGLRTVLAHCRDRGYEPTFHHETGTYVEAPWEIERVLELTDVGLCLDTGHYLLGGGDPAAAMGQWRERINQVHLKDARREVIEQIVEDHLPTEQIWGREAFPPLGKGDVDLDAVIALLHSTGYQGWVVVEQDTLPRTAERFARAAEDQRTNRDYLRQRGL
jgi:inosose dehydratase